MRPTGARDATHRAPGRAQRREHRCRHEVNLVTWLGLGVGVGVGVGLGVGLGSGSGFDVRGGDVRGSKRVEERERDGGRAEVRAAVEREG